MHPHFNAIGLTLAQGKVIMHKSFSYVPCINTSQPSDFLHTLTIWSHTRLWSFARSLRPDFHPCTSNGFEVQLTETISAFMQGAPHLLAHRVKKKFPYRYKRKNNCVKKTHSPRKYISLWSCMHAFFFLNKLKYLACMLMEKIK